MKKLLLLLIPIILLITACIPVPIEVQNNSSSERIVTMSYTLSNNNMILIEDIECPEGYVFDNKGGIVSITGQNALCIEYKESGGNKRLENTCTYNATFDYICLIEGEI